MPSPGRPASAAPEVHLWRIALAQVPAGIDPLDADERERAARLPAGDPRRSFQRARAALRRILAHHLGSRPEALRFEYGPNGKPALAGADATAGLEFNLSHSRGLALVAVARGARLGVDVQASRDDVDVLDLAAHFFAPEEAEALRELEPAPRRDRFFRDWTRKEALVKAQGGRIEVGLGAPASPVAARDAGWSLRDLALPLGYVGALVQERRAGRLRTRDFARELGAPAKAMPGARKAAQGRSVSR